MRNRLHVVQTTTGPNGIHATRLIVLVPRATLLLPDRMGDEFLTVRVEGVGDAQFGVEGLEALALHFADRLQGVGGDAPEGAHDRAVFHRPGGADVGDEVGEVGYGEAEVGFWADFPFGCEVGVVQADDGEAGAVGDVEAGGADDGVWVRGLVVSLAWGGEVGDEGMVRTDFALYAVGTDDAVFGDLGHGREVHVYIWLLDGFHVGVTRGDAAAADAPFGGEAWERRC